MTAKKRTWRQFSQTPAYGFVMGALFMLLAASHWQAVITNDNQRVEHIILGAVQTLGAIGFLGSAIVQLRRIFKARISRRL